MSNGKSLMMKVVTKKVTNLRDHPSLPNHRVGSRGPRRRGLRVGMKIIPGHRRRGKVGMMIPRLRRGSVGMMMTASTTTTRAAFGGTAAEVNKLDWQTGGKKQLLTLR